MSRTIQTLFAHGLLACWLAISPAMAAAPLQKVSITIPSVEVADSPYFVAAQKGYFAEEGLDVQFVFAGGGTAIPALLSKEVEGSASGSAALSAILRGAPLRIIMVFNDTPAYSIWAKSDLGSLKDLVGKTLAVPTRGDTFEIAARLGLQKAGIAPDSVGYIPLGSGGAVGAAFKTGTIPAAVLSTGESMALQNAGELKNMRVLARLQGEVRMPWNAFAVSEALLKDKPALSEKMVTAIVKGARYMQAYKPETVAIVGKYKKNPDPIALGMGYDEFLAARAENYVISDADISSDLTVRAGLLGLAKNKIPPIERIYDFNLVRAVNAKLDASNWRPER